jgi:hypothetical protein
MLFMQNEPKPKLKLKLKIGSAWISIVLPETSKALWIDCFWISLRRQMKDIVTCGRY